MLKRRNLTGIALSLAVLMAPQAHSEDHLDSRNGIRHVLLISIDGMHALDYENCVKGGYCPNLAALGRNGVNYTRTSTSRPSDSFPGLMALVTGGTPRSVGAFYDVAYDRVLAPPLHDTGNGLAGGTCHAGVANGTTTEYEEGVEIDQSALNGGGPYGTFDGGIKSIDPTRLPRDPFNGCQPVEVIAASGPQTLRFGPMKPVGLRDPRTGRRPWAVVQLRQDNALGTLWNIVGFQTKLKHGEQTRLFRTIPGLANAEFARLGGLHRNTFLNSPRLLDDTLRLRAMPRLRFAGQITGCEGYVESAAIGLLTGRFAAAERRGFSPVAPPSTTAMGALLGHITGGADAKTFQPMNVNFGLFPPIEGTWRGKERKQALAARALSDLGEWLQPTPLAAE